MSSKILKLNQMRRIKMDKDVNIDLKIKTKLNADLPNQGDL